MPSTPPNNPRQIGRSVERSGVLILRQFFSCVAKVESLAAQVGTIEVIFKFVGEETELRMCQPDAGTGATGFVQANKQDVASKSESSVGVCVALF